MESDRLRAGKRYYILVQDRVGSMQERIVLPFGAMESTPTQVLKGELLEALPETEQPNDSTRMALTGNDRKRIRLECRTEDTTRLTIEDANLLLAISSVGLRYQSFIDRKRLDFGRQISPGSQVFVEVKGFSNKLHGLVWYIGELPSFHGTMFGVELLVSKLNTTDLPLFQFKLCQYSHLLAIQTYNRNGSSVVNRLIAHHYSTRNFLSNNNQPRTSLSLKPRPCLGQKNSPNTNPLLPCLGQTWAKFLYPV